MRKILKIILGLVLILVITKLIPIKKNEGDLNLKVFIEDTKPSKEVLNILKNACYDCHSDYTKYPEYYQYPLINLWIARHINEGKEHLNFSHWEKYNHYQKDFMFSAIINELVKHKMPLKSYLVKHPEAVIQKKDMDLIIKWCKKNKSNKK